MRVCERLGIQCAHECTRPHVPVDAHSLHLVVFSTLFFARFPPCCFPVYHHQVLSADLVSRVKLLSSKDQLGEYISEEQLPRHLGGQLPPMPDPESL